MKDQRTRRQHLRRRAGIVGGIQRPLGHGDIDGRLDEFRELTIGDGQGVDEEGTDLDAMLRRFLGVVPIRPHKERAALDVDHLPHIGAPLLILVTGRR